MADRVLTNSDLLCCIFDFLPSCNLRRLVLVSKQWRGIATLLIKQRINDILTIYIDSDEWKFEYVLNSDQNVELHPRKEKSSMMKRKWDYYEILLKLTFQCHFEQNCVFTFIPVRGSRRKNRWKNGIVIEYFFQVSDQFPDCYNFYVKKILLPMTVIFKGLEK